MILVVVDGVILSYDTDFAKYILFWTLYYLLSLAEDTIEIGELAILNNNEGDWADSVYVLGGSVMDGVGYLCAKYFQSLSQMMQYCIKLYIVILNKAEEHF